MAMTRRIGIYSGTFDPVHEGHTAFALAAVKECRLDEVVLLPERNPRGKAGVSDILHREVLLQRATALSPALRVLMLPSTQQFTVAETLPELQRLFDDAELTLLVGSDVVRTFDRWEHFAVLAAEVSFAIGMRGVDMEEDVAVVLRQVEQRHGAPIRHTFIRTGHATASSSRIRALPS